MAARDIRIEIVPFPEPSPESDADDEIGLAVSAAGGDAPEEGDRVDDAEEVETEPVTELDVDDELVVDGAPDVEAAAEPDPEPEPESEPESDPDDSGDGEPVDRTEPDADADTDADTDTDTDTEFVPTPGARAARRRASEVVKTPTSLTDESPAIPSDDSVMRTTSISGRLLFLTLGSVLLAAIVVIASVWGVSRVSNAGRQIATIGTAKELNGEAITELRLLHSSSSPDAPGAVDDTQRLQAAARDADDAARPWVPAAVVQAAEATTSGYVAGDGSDRAYRDAIEARTELDGRLRDRQLRAVDHSESLRTAAIAIVLVLFALGSLGLVLMGRFIGRSVVAPLRSLGRNLRRFGDGDLRSRSAVAPDEVGTLARSFNVMADSVSARVRRLNADAERDSQLRMVGDALDLADRETDVYRILEQALAILTPENPGELLVNEPTSPRLWQVSVNPSSGPGGCPVETADACVAMRRAQAVVFDGPTAINACPQLRLHAEACSAACVPVGVNGHLLGVVHVTAPEHEPPAPEVVEQLVTLAGQVGVRVGAQRTLETTRLQASTDGLTGLANRRMLEARLGDLLRGQVGFALAVADVDHFKRLNDSYGHEIGDRALQVFAKVLEDNVRGHDVVARYGGEEFVLVYPELSVSKAMEVLERIRQALGPAIDAAGLPQFTCSFGVTHSSSADNVDAIIRVADAGLLKAKDEGRNRVVFADVDLAAKVFGGNGGSMVSSSDAEADAAPDDHDAVIDLTAMEPVETD